MLRDADPNYFAGIYIVCGYTDLRYGIDSLAAIIEQKYKLSLFESYSSSGIRFTHADHMQNSSNLLKKKPPQKVLSL